MKKCAKCGKENIDKAIYCANCGVKLDSNSSYGGLTPSSNSSNDNSNSGSSLRSTSNNSTIKETKEGPSKLKVFCCYVPLVLLILFVIFAMILNAFPESFTSSYQGDFKYLDYNGDGKLSFDEARQLDPYMKDKEIRPYFLEADKNNNGYLIGHEFDFFRSDVIPYDSSSSSSSSSGSSSGSKSNSHTYSSSSHSSSNDNYDSSSEGYVLTCPYCGSEAIYETGGYYKCAECGRSIYSPDDLELAYEEGYMELLVPASLIIN